MGPINELTSALYRGLLKDATGAVVPASVLTAVQLTLYDLKTDTIINSRDSQDVLNVNGVTFAEDGTFSWIMQPEDNAILNQDSKKVEDHIALFLIEWPGGQFYHQATISVTPMKRVP